MHASDSYRNLTHNNKHNTKTKKDKVFFYNFYRLGAFFSWKLQGVISRSVLGKNIEISLI